MFVAFGAIRENSIMKFISGKLYQVKKDLAVFPIFVRSSRQYRDIQKVKAKEIVLFVEFRDFKKRGELPYIFKGLFYRTAVFLTGKGMVVDFCVDGDVKSVLGHCLEKI